MKLRSRTIRSLRGPVILFVTAMVLVVALLVLWNVVLAVDYQRIKALAAQVEGGGAFHWTFIALGSALFVTIIVLLSVLGAQLFGEIRFTQRLSDFVASVTHELNSPLASIKLFAQTLLKKDLPPDQRERFLHLILADTERLHGQIQNVLRAAQFDGPLGVELALETVDLRAYLEEYLRARRAALEHHQQGVLLTLRDGLSPQVRLDRQLFRQALDNVVDNAIKYGRPGAVHVALELRDAGPERVLLEVHDDGCGIPKADLEHVFDRFHRVAQPSGETTRRQGTGLGLWIVRALVSAHEGEVSAHSEGPGKGTTIRIALPRSAPAQPPEVALAGAPAREGQGEGDAT